MHMVVACKSQVLLCQLRISAIISLFASKVRKIYVTKFVIPSSIPLLHVILNLFVAFCSFNDFEIQSVKGVKVPKCQKSQNFLC